MNLEVSDIYNTNLESGIRVVAMLGALHPGCLDFEDLLKTDYILVNSGDFSGPPSLHTKVPNRKGELITRRETVRSGIELMRRFGFVSVNLSENGIGYVATEEVKPLLKLMETQYSKDLQSIACWLAVKIKESEFSEFDDALTKVMCL